MHTPEGRGRGEGENEGGSQGIRENREEKSVVEVGKKIYWYILFPKKV